MSCLEKQDFAAAVIDSLKFAAGHESISGSVAVARLARLTDMLAGTDGGLDCSLEGFSFDGVLAGRVGLHLQVTGQLRLYCQRCLAEVLFDCAIDSRLLLVANESDVSQWPEDELEVDEFDAIPASREMSLLTLLEDEVLLALPVVPRHADCVLPAGCVVDAVVDDSENEPSPFAVLAGLKKH